MEDKFINISLLVTLLLPIWGGDYLEAIRNDPSSSL